MQKTGLLHGDLTYKLIGLAMEVHKRLGPGFREGLYDDTFLSNGKEFWLATNLKLEKT